MLTGVFLNTNTFGMLSLCRGSSDFLTYNSRKDKDVKSSLEKIYQTYWETNIFFNVKKLKVSLAADMFLNHEMYQIHLII